MEKVYSYLEGYDKVYCYPNSNVLKNKLNITNDIFLKRVEGRLVSLHLDELYDSPIKGNFDFEHLKKINKHLFQDIYDWAGEVRSCNLAKMNMFCLPQNIDSYANEIFTKLKMENYYFNYDYDKKIVSLANLFSDINSLHAFREGNGRTEREFIEQLAKANKINLDLTLASKEEIIRASFNGVNGDNSDLVNIFFNCSNPLIEEKVNYL